jgi:hypothetical protein
MEPVVTNPARVSPVGIEGGERFAVLPGGRLQFWEPYASVMTGGW